MDSRSEFKSRYMLGFYKEQGILLEKPCPYYPQQNGMVEGKYKHLLEMAR